MPSLEGSVYASSRQHEALEVFRAAAGADDVEGLYHLGVHLLEYPELERDPGEGRRALERAAGRGSADAQVSVGEQLLVAGDPGGSLDLFRAAAQQGHRIAARNLGIWHLGRAEIEAAQSWFAAASIDSMEQLVVLGGGADRPVGTFGGPEHRADEHLADSGDPAASFRMGQWCSRMSLTASANDYLSRAARGGDHRAVFALATLHWLRRNRADGHRERALALWAEAAELGVPFAAYNLGLLALETRDGPAASRMLGMARELGLRYEPWNLAGDL